MKIVSDVFLKVNSSSGHSIALQPHQPVEVSDVMASIAISKGARAYQEQKVEAKPKEEAEAASLEDTLAQIMEDGDPKNFKADGSPKAAAVNNAMGKTVSTQEREAAWESVLNS